MQIFHYNLKYFFWETSPSFSNCDNRTIVLSSKYLAVDVQNDIGILALNTSNSNANWQEITNVAPDIHCFNDQVSKNWVVNAIDMSALRVREQLKVMPSSALKFHDRLFTYDEHVPMMWHFKKSSCSQLFGSFRNNRSRLLRDATRINKKQSVANKAAGRSYKVRYDFF